MIRDRIVVGLLDAGLSMKLQMDPDLTLDKAVTMARQSEAIKQQQVVVRGGTGSNHPGINAITKDSRKRRQGGGRPRRQVPPKVTSQKPTCTRCGRSPPHARQQCPAREAVCHKCAKKGHFQSVCRSEKTVAAVQADADDDGFLGTVTAQVQTSLSKVGIDRWMVELLQNSSPVQFKIDTGADVSYLSPCLNSSVE